MHWWVHFSHFHSLVLLFLYLLCVSLQSNEEAMSKLQITTCRKALEPRCVVFTTVTFWHDRFSFLPPGGSLAPSKIFRRQSFAIRGWKLSLLIFIWGPGRSWLIIKRRKKLSWSRSSWPVRGCTAFHLLVCPPRSRCCPPRRDAKGQRNENRLGRGALISKPSSTYRWGIDAKNGLHLNIELPPVLTRVWDFLPRTSGNGQRCYMCVKMKVCLGDGIIL